MDIKIKIVNNGTIVKYALEGDACCDCYANEEVVIKSGERKIVGLGFALELPKGYEALIRPRSGLTSKGIDIGLGTIDEGYRGEVKACVINNSGNDFEVTKGFRICQMAIRPIPKIRFVEVKELSESERGNNGFGSTGV